MLTRQVAAGAWLLPPVAAAGRTRPCRGCGRLPGRAFSGPVTHAASRCVDGIQRRRQAGRVPYNGGLQKGPRNGPERGGLAGSAAEHSARAGWSIARRRPARTRRIAAGCERSMASAASASGSGSSSKDAPFDNRRGEVVDLHKVSVNTPCNAPSAPRTDLRAPGKTGGARRHVAQARGDSAAGTLLGASGRPIGGARAPLSAFAS